MPLPVTHCVLLNMYTRLLFFKSVFKGLMISFLFYFIFLFDCFVSASEGSLLLPPAPRYSFTSGLDQSLGLEQLLLLILP